MRFIPGSHWLGHLTYALTENDDSNVLNQTVAVDQLAAPVDDELKAGEISIHSDLLVHGVGSECLRAAAVRVDAAVLSHCRCARNWDGMPRA